MYSSLIINCIIEFTSSILVTLSLEMQNKRLYLIGIILSLIFNIYMTIYFSAVGAHDYKLLFNTENPTVKYPDFRGGKGAFIFNMIFHILIQWIQSGVLIAYFNKVKSSFNKPYLNPVFTQDSPDLIADYKNTTEEGETAPI